MRNRCISSSAAMPLSPLFSHLKIFVTTQMLCLLVLPALAILVSLKKHSDQGEL